MRGHCAAEAIEKNLEFGVWGGMTERKRRAAIKNAIRRKGTTEGLVSLLRAEGNTVLREAINFD